MTKQDLKNRPHYQEVAEVFEEIIQATEKGLFYLPNRLNRAPGQVNNEAKAQRAQWEKEDMERQAQKEALRKKRDDHVKKVIKESNYGGRELPIDQYKKLKTKTEAKELTRIGKEERKEFQEQTKLNKERVDTIKAQQMEELAQKKSGDIT